MVGSSRGNAAALRLLAVAAVVHTWLGPVSAGAQRPRMPWHPPPGPHGSDPFADEKRAVLLNVQNFDAHLQEKRDQQRPLLVMFHVSWCKVCQRSFPEFAAASEKVHELSTGIDFAHVDCTNEKALCTRYTVKGYPSIKLFTAEAQAEPRSFSGQRNQQNFVKYAERMMKPPIQKFDSKDEFIKALSTESYSAFVVQADLEPPAAVVSAAETWMDRHLFTSARQFGDLLPQGAPQPPADARFAVLSIGGQQWPGRDNTTASPPAAIFYAGDIENETAVSAWISRHRFPGVWKLGEGNFFEFTHASRPTVILAADSAHISEEEESAMRGAVSELGEEFIFGFVDGNAWAEELWDFAIYKKDLPRVLITEDNFDSWVEDMEALTLHSLASDLRKILDGAPVLRQGRTALAKAKFWKREAYRTILQMEKYASKGPKEATLVCAGVFLGVLVLLVVLWCVFMLLRILLSDPEPEWVPRYQEQQKRKQQ